MMPVKTAKFVRALTPSRDGQEISLYKLSSPFISERLYSFQNPVEFVIVSAVPNPETYVFKADSEGSIISWHELEGSFQGEMNHEKALRGLGYQLIK